MRIAIAGDHYTVGLIEKLTAILQGRGFEIHNLGTKSAETKISLQEIIPAVAREIQSGEADLGILICGTGVGVEIGANRFKGIRASLCRDVKQAKNARIYDNTNVLCLGSWYKDDFEDILTAWLDSDFDGNEKRAQMLRDFDEMA